MQNSDAALLGVNTTESFSAVVDYVRKTISSLDCIMLTGDLSQDGSEESYQRIAKLLAPLSVPVYVIPGNHDDEAMLASVYPALEMKMQKHVLFSNWQLIFLDSHVHGKVEGYLAQSELDFLQTVLTNYSQPAMIVFHHHPLVINCAWLDPLGLQNADQFWQLIKNYPHVQMVVNGHVHQAYQATHQSVSCYMTPSTCIQFKPQQTNFALDNNPPGFRLFTLHDDGTHETEVIRLPAYIGMFDANAGGY